MEWTRKKLINAYIDFFKSKNHKEIPNAPLIPENDPTVLFTTAGMHPLVPYLLGQPHPSGKRLCNVQKCIRTGDIDEVGDKSHLTFFEMLGNWSVGDYFKKEAIEFSFEFLTRVLNIPISHLAVTVFEGDSDAPKDKEAFETWKKLGIPEERIAFMPKKNNWWGPAGKTGPCGPDTEMFYWVGNGEPKGNPKTHEAEWLEIWNDVLMEYTKNDEGKYVIAKQQNIDTGMGVERTIAILNKMNQAYLTDSFKTIIQKIEKLSNKEYGENEATTKSMRIIADHIKASTMILAEETVPSNKEQGYVLRRLIRRAIRHGNSIGIKENFAKTISREVIKIYDDYSHLQKNKEFVLEEIEKEEIRFKETLEKGLRYFEKISENKKRLSGEESFLLYQSYGFPIEMILELAQEKKIKVDMNDFEKEFEKHQDLSRTATEGKFKSGLADNSQETTKLHTATHLLNQALREILGKQDIHQKGSNITPERLRFDFNFDRKLTPCELQQIEDWVNEKIEKNLPVNKAEMTIEEAKKFGAQGVFEHKYGEKVFVYYVGDKTVACSKEICAGPHVEKAGILAEDGKKFKIQKEESVSAGVRRIKASLA